MKSIAVFTTDFILEHCQDFIKGVLDYYKDKPDVSVFVTQTQFYKDSLSVFDYQYWSGAEILKSKQIDAYIILSSVYCSIWDKNKLKEIAGSLGDRPVISASIDLEQKSTYAVLHDSKKGYEDVIKHLKNEHGCKKIAFMSANSTRSTEAYERYNSFLNAMKENNLEFDDSMLFDGSFDENVAEKELKTKLKTREDVKFDALVCASDLMAVGSMRALNSIGISVPEDVKIIGFDDSIFASLSTPKLSTISQSVISQGSCCAELAYKIVSGEKVDKLVYSDLKTIYRQSCGCIDKSNQNQVYMNEKNQVCNDDSGRRNLLDMYMNEIQEKHKYISLLDRVKVSNTLRQFFFNMNFIVDIAMLENMAICLYEEPIFQNRQDEFVLPEIVEMYMYSDRSLKSKAFKPGILFNPAERICPIDDIREEKGAFIVYPIFSGETNYGYIVAKPKKSNMGAYTLNMKILIAAISSAVEYSRKN